MSPQMFTKLYKLASTATDAEQLFNDMELTVDASSAQMNHFRQTLEYQREDLHDNFDKGSTYTRIMMAREILDDINNPYTLPNDFVELDENNQIVKS